MDYEKLSQDLLEVSSEQRLRILFDLHDKESNISSMAKNLDATAPEVHRNFNRMVKAKIIKKNMGGTYSLSNYGKILRLQILNIKSGHENKIFFETHDYGNIPDKFIRRLGELNEKKHLKGFVKILETWNSIHKNSEKYVYNILHEIPYGNGLIDIVESKLSKGVKIRSVIAEHAVTSEKRNEVFKKKNFQKFIESGILERRMMKDLSVVVLLNEIEAAIIFPNEGKPDMSEIFYSKDSDFHDWCLDFFMYCWNESSSFREDSLDK